MIPQSIKTVFDTFPLVTNPPTANTTPGNYRYVEDKKFYFGGKTDGSFLLGVHNTFHHTDGSGVTRILPTDPESLAYALVLAHKNKLTLPRPGSTGKSALFIASYHSSPSDQLPMLIEDTTSPRLRVQENHEKQTDTVAHRSFINLSQTLDKYSESSSERLINNLVDTQFQDLWILCLLSEKLDLQTWNRIIDVDPEVATSPQINNLVVSHLLADIPSWHDFSVRHPNLFDTPSRTAGVDYLFRSNLVQVQYKLQLEEFERTLAAVYDYVKDKKPELLEFKLAAFVVIFTLLLKGTEVAKKVQWILEYANEVIGKY